MMLICVMFCLSKIPPAVPLPGCVYKIEKELSPAAGQHTILLTFRRRTARL